MFDTTTLKNWFLQEKRTLPWRSSISAYRVWISEVMLQQTQVSVVIPYFERWMELFPDIPTLASASIDQVIKAWEGLGYYSRARNLHHAAKYLVEQHGGILPKDAKDLGKIKGLGPYTIAAIQAFAFHERAAPVDGNVYRVLSRYFKVEEDLDKSATKRRLQEYAFKILPTQAPWILSEALIELGATVCQKKPNCHICPLKGSCQAFAHGMAHLLPHKTKKTIYEKLERSVTLLIYKDKLFVERCKSGRIMSDLHEFFFFEHQLDSRGMKAKLASMGICAEYRGTLPEVSHSFTKYRVKLFPFVFEVEHEFSREGFEWKSIQDLKNLAFSSGHKRVFQHFLNWKECLE